MAARIEELVRAGAGAAADAPWSPVVRLAAGRAGESPLFCVHGAAGTVAVFPHEDRNSVHRLKADESCEIGEPAHPVRAYLNVAAVVSAAQRAGADAVYPG